MDAKGYMTYKAARDTGFTEDCAAPETKELIAQLRRGGFVVHDDADELGSLKKRFECLKENSPIFRLYVIPTSLCNFSCKYCYYAGSGESKMTEEVQDALLAFTQKRLAGKRTLNVVWTGGEPTLAPDVVARLSRGFMRLAKEADVDYISAVFTNGYLFDRETAIRFRDYGVAIAQFVLDGPREIHNDRRPLADGSGTYDTIIKNLRDVSGIMDIAIRINIDAANADRQHISSLLASLRQCNLPSSTIIELAPVTGYTSQCGEYVRKYGFRKKEIARKFAELYPLVYESGFEPKFKICNTEPVSPCTSDSCFGVSKDGDLYRCFLLIGEERERAGHILDAAEVLEHNKSNTKWNEWDPFSKAMCLECNVFPLCLGGSGCPLYDVVEDGHLRGDVPCIPLKFYLDDAMELNYRMRKERRKAHKCSIEDSAGQT
jgi:uncharacterized protein